MQLVGTVVGRRVLPKITCAIMGLVKRWEANSENDCIRCIVYGEPIALVMRMRRLEWFRLVKRRDKTENIRSVVEMKMAGKRPRGRPKLRWKDTVGRDLKAWNIIQEWATDRERWKVIYNTRYPAQGDGGER